MSRIPPLSASDALGGDKNVEFAREFMGYVPNDLRTIAHWPELSDALRQLIGVVYGESQVADSTKRLVGHAASTAAGCRYCQAHTGYGSARSGIPEEKILALYDFENSDLFDQAEKAAIDLAFAAGASPNGATDAHFERLSQHFSAREQVEIVAVIGMFGFLNRWNDTLATELEDAPMGFADSNLSQHGWEIGDHAAR